MKPYLKYILLGRIGEVMNIIEPEFCIDDEIEGNEVLKKLERAARVCYKSEHRITDDSAQTLIRNIINRGHESVIEHEVVTVRIVCDRGVSHEIVRHRIASYSQESTRYCNYFGDKFGNELTFIKPYFWEEDKEKYEIWKDAMQYIESTYMKLIAVGAEPQEARSILPNSLKTEIVVTMNLREWRHFFKLRAGAAAHPQMRQIAVPMLRKFQEMIPIIFDGIDDSNS